MPRFIALCRTNASSWGVTRPSDRMLSIANSSIEGFYGGNHILSGRYKRMLLESLDTAMKQSWRDDLAEINRLSGLSFGKPFMSASVAERTRLLERISRNERNPKDPGDFAFGTIKWQVTFVYYKTKIGIHDDLKYQGNTILDEFVGADPGKL